MRPIAQRGRRYQPRPSASFVLILPSLMSASSALIISHIVLL
nr:MAG TPA: hypothetical protein [Caudoviricetes sp.]